MKIKKQIRKIRLANIKVILKSVEGNKQQLDVEYKILESFSPLELANCLENFANHLKTLGK